MLRGNRVPWSSSFREDGKVAFGDCEDDFEDQTLRHRHVHTGGQAGPFGKHYVDVNGVLQQPVCSDEML